MEKSDLLIKVLGDLQDPGILKHLILVGSWCQDFYRYQYGNPKEIPATKTMDADILIPRRMPRINPAVDIAAIMKKNDLFSRSARVQACTSLIIRCSRSSFSPIPAQSPTKPPDISNSWA
jgi:hypothetical protein